MSTLNYDAQLEMEQRAQLQKMVDDFPAKFRWCSLARLQPSPASQMRLEDQSRLYDELRRFPADGWAFFSPAGFGKTTMSYCLYRRALGMNFPLWDGRFEIDHDYKWTRPADAQPLVGVWRKSVPDLLQQHYDMFNAGTDADGHRRHAVKPDITVEKIERAVRRGYKPRVFFEEIDKIKPSEFNINQLFRIFDAMYRHEGQIVLDSNMSAAQFEDTFGKGIARRVAEMCHVKEFGF